MIPTTYELATLAAMQQGTPAEKARAALTLWNACAVELERAAALQARIAAGAAKQNVFVSMFAGREIIPLEDFLRELMPQSKVEDRMRKFRTWTRDNIALHHGVQGDALETAAEKAIQRDRAGIRPAQAYGMAESFSNFLERDRKAQNTARAKKAADAKKSLGTDLKAKKTPQAKRNPRQGKR